MILTIRRLFILAIMFYSGMLTGQNSNDARPVTTTYYIKNAFVVQNPGTVLPATSVVIKEGLIINIGKNISIPWDAKVIDADSMYLYAAFIDAATHTGIPKDDKNEKPDIDDPGNPPNKVAGITPQHKAQDFINYRDKSIEEMRASGYGYLHVMPRGRMLPGSASVITTGVGDRSSMLIKENTAMYCQLRSASGVFPNTVIGVMSKYRDIYKNAEYVYEYKSVYSKNPEGLTRPNSAIELEAMASVVNHKMPVFFKAQNARDIFKVLTLQNDLGFDLVLTDVRQADKLTAKLKDIPVIVSLKLPKKLDDQKNKDDSDEQDQKDSKTKEETKSKEDNPGKKAFDKRKMDSYIAYESQAAELANTGFNFSFSTLSVKPKDVKENIIRMINRGLEKNDALAALTTNAASIIGISEIAGTIEKGKLGNVFLTDKPYFEENSKIKIAIIDGKLFEYKEKEKKKDGSDKITDLSGKWSYTIEIPGEERSGTMVISKDEETYQIKLDTEENPGDYIEAFDITTEGNNISFLLTVNDQGVTLNISSDMTFDEDTYEGSMNIENFGSFSVAGSKLDPK